MRPFAAADGHDAPWLIDELVPGFAAMVDDVFMGSEDPVGQPVVAHELPDIFNRIQLGTFGWESDDADVCGHIQLARHVPASLIHQHDRVSARGDGERYLGEMQGHGFGIAEGQHQPGALALFRADRTEDVGRFRPLVLGRRWPCAAPRPAPRDFVLLADAGFVLEPDLYRRAAREGGFDLCQRGGKAPFLKSSIAYSFWAW